MTFHSLTAEIEVVRKGFQLNLELELRSGTTTILVGPNGAGKSTVLSALAGITPLKTGRVSLGDRVLTDTATGQLCPIQDRKTCLVFQDFLLFPHLTVLDNVAYPSRAGGMNRTTSRTHAQKWLNKFSLSDLANSYPRELSGGQSQRVALTRALAAEPDILLLDEPLAALDVLSRSEMHEVLREYISEFSGPVLMVTHDWADVLALAQNVVILEHGSVTQRGTLQEIMNAPATAYAAALTASSR